MQQPTYSFIGGCTKISDAGLIPFFLSCPQLRTLEIKYGEAHLINCYLYLFSDIYKITDAAIIELAKNCTNLKELSVASCKLSSVAIEKLAKYCPGLVSLNIIGVDGITDSTIKALASKYV